MSRALRGSRGPSFPVRRLRELAVGVLQLVWQALGLALLLMWGSSQSKESDLRVEAELDRLLLERGIDPGEISRQVDEHVAERHGRS